MRIAIDLFNFFRGNSLRFRPSFCKRAIGLRTIQAKLSPKAAENTSIRRFLCRIVLENLVVAAVQLIVREMGVTLRDGDAPMAGELLSQF